MLQPRKVKILPVNTTAKDNIVTNKSDKSLMLQEEFNINKDKKELSTTGTIKTPKSIVYKKTQYQSSEVKKDLKSKEEREGKLNVLQKPLIYLANPEKVLGDLGVPDMETSELDRQRILANSYNKNQSNTQRFKNVVKMGTKYVPAAAANTALTLMGTPSQGNLISKVASTVANTISPINIKNPLNELSRKHLINQATLVKDLFNKNNKIVVNNAFKSKNRIYKEIEDGANTLDKEITSKLLDLNTDEGKRRLLKQERGIVDEFYKKDIFMTDKDKKYIAEANATSRTDELEFIKHFGNINKDFVNEVNKKNISKLGIVKPDIETVLYNRDIPNNNAYYSPDNLVKYDPSGSRNIPGKLVLGNSYAKSTPTAAHEVNHALQRDRRTTIDKDLLNLEVKDKKELNYDDVNNYMYFKHGSDGLEPSSFLSEIRSKMKQDGFIKHDYDTFTPELIEKAHNFYQKNKTKTIYLNKNGLNSSTDTRIFDFSKPSKANFDLLSNNLNDLVHNTNKKPNKNIIQSNTANA